MATASVYSASAEEPTLVRFSYYAIPYVGLIRIRSTVFGGDAPHGEDCFDIVSLRRQRPVSQVGLLPRGNLEQVPFAYSLYNDDSRKGVELAHGFKHAFSRHVRISFLGVWWVDALHFLI